MHNIVDEELLTFDQIERLKQEDTRFADVDVYIQIENELRNSIALRLIRESAAEQAQAAMEELICVNPADASKITELQARVYRARFIAMTLNNAMIKGKIAERSLSDEIIETEGENR